MITVCKTCHVIGHELTSTDGDYNCFDCNKTYKKLNLVPCGDKPLTEKEFDNISEYKKAIYLFECPYCGVQVGGYADLRNVQKALGIFDNRYFYGKR